MERTDQPTRQPTPAGPREPVWGTAALRLRDQLRAMPHPAAEPRTVRHANGLEFRVIPADSYDARMARDVRQLTMDDGTVWTVGAPIGWHGVAAAWEPAVTA